VNPLKKIARPFAVAGVGALMAVTLAACGGSPPTNASVEDFCAVGDELDGLFSDLADDDFEGFVDAASEAADRLSDVGTPEDISEDAREGFELMIDILEDLDADEMQAAQEAWDARVDEATESGDFSELQDVNPFNELMGITEEDETKFQAFTQYADSTCD
jgi:hypothetical protein